MPPSLWSPGLLVTEVCCKGFEVGTTSYRGSPQSIHNVNHTVLKGDDKRVPNSDGFVHL